MCSGVFGSYCREREWREEGGEGRGRHLNSIQTGTLAQTYTRTERERRRQGKKVGEEGRGKVWNSDEAIMPSTAPQ